MTVREWRRVRKAAHESCLRDEALILVMYECGLRREEPGVIRWSYLNKLRQGKIYIWRGKDSRSGFMELSPDTQSILKLWLAEVIKKNGHAKPQPDWPVFPGYSNRGISGRAVYNIFNGLAEEAGLPKSLRFPHALKHSRVQHLLEAASRAGEDPWRMFHTVAQLVGHKVAKTTIEHYARATGREMEFARKVTKELVR